MTLPTTVTPAQAAAREWDVLVVGAGPAGAVAAHQLARRGLSVLLVDRTSFPRRKVCGCCLSGRALATLGRVGLGHVPAACRAVPLGEVRLAARGRSARVALAGGVALSREAFDAALVREAVGAGVHFLPRTQAALVGTGEAGPPRRLVRLHQGGEAVQAPARVVLAADGLGGQVLARAGAGRAPVAPGARIGAGAVVEGGPAFYGPGTVFMACGAGGYVGLVRLEDGRLDLAAALDPTWVRGCGGPGQAATRLLAEAGWPAPRELAEGPWRGTPALTRRARRLAAERVFVVGDAAGYVEPFTGEGMGWALAGGVAVAPLAARASVCWHPALARAWAGEYRRVVGRRLASRAAAAVLRHPLLARAVIGLLARAPALALPVVRHLNV